MTYKDTVIGANDVDFDVDLFLCGAPSYTDNDWVPRPWIYSEDGANVALKIRTLNAAIQTEWYPASANTNYHTPIFSEQVGKFYSESVQFYQYDNAQLDPLYLAESNAFFAAAQTYANPQDHLFKLPTTCGRLGGYGNAVTLPLTATAWVGYEFYFTDNPDKAPQKASRHTYVTYATSPNAGDIPSSAMQKYVWGLVDEGVAPADLVAADIQFGVLAVRSSPTTLTCYCVINGQVIHQCEAAGIEVGGNTLAATFSYAARLIGTFDVRANVGQASIYAPDGFSTTVSAASFRSEGLKALYAVEVLGGAGSGTTYINSGEFEMASPPAGALPIIPEFWTSFRGSYELP